MQVHFRSFLDHIKMRRGMQESGPSMARSLLPRALCSSASAAIPISSSIITPRSTSQFQSLAPFPIALISKPYPHLLFQSYKTNTPLTSRRSISTSPPSRSDKSSKSGPGLKSRRIEPIERLKENRFQHFFTQLSKVILDTSVQAAGARPVVYYPTNPEPGPYVSINPGDTKNYDRVWNYPTRDEEARPATTATPQVPTPSALPPAVLDRIKTLIAGVTRNDLGFDLGPDIPAPVSQGRLARWFENKLKNTFDPHRVTAFDIYSSGSFQLAYFYIPKGVSIPLHDHPSMTVFTKLLYGKLQIRCYDWATDSFKPGSGVLQPTQLGSVNPARFKTEVILTYNGADDVTTAPVGVLDDEPTKEQMDLVHLTTSTNLNLHCVTALETSAMLDILAPPYGIDGRDCNYYEEVEPKGNQPKRDPRDVGLRLIPEPDFQV